MKRLSWRSVLTLLLVASLGANVWFANTTRMNAGRIRQGAAYLTWGANYALNGLVESIDNPQADWNSPGFQANLLELFEWAVVYSQSASSTVGGVVTGPYDDVITSLNQLGFTMTDYRSLVQQALRTGQFPAENKAKLKRLAANLRAAGWPRKPVSRDDAAQWGELAAALDQFLKLDADHPSR